MNINSGILPKKPLPTLQGKTNMNLVMLPRNSWVVYSVKRNNSFSKILYELKNERKRKIKNEIILIQINSCMEEKKKEIK